MFKKKLMNLRIFENDTNIIDTAIEIENKERISKELNSKIQNLFLKIFL